MAVALQTAGARVAVTGRSSEHNTAVGEHLVDGDAAVHELDVRDETAIQQTVANVIDRLGHIDILINNAGIVSNGPATETSREDWDAVITTDLTGPFLCAQHVARAMIARGKGGKIINLGSIYSLLGTPAYASYGAAKAGLLGLTRALAIELAPDAIQVNAILPGWFETDMTADMGADRRQQIADRTPAARWGQPDDLAGAAVFLSSHASDFITGASLLVDGGFSISPR
jgi:2-dehydro-3-deoxy-D-gluconate 5-dehydrogenase